MLYKENTINNTNSGLTNKCSNCRCGTSWDTTTLSNTPCPNRTDSECKSGEKCFADITKK